MAAALPATETPPARLSPAGGRAALGEAIIRARETDVLGPLARAVDQPGFRRRLAEQFAAWIRAERHPASPPPSRGAVDVARWAVFGHFGETLGDIGARTPEGWATWASRRLVENPLSGWRNLADTLVAVVEPVAASPAIRRAVEFFRDRAGAMIVSLPYDPEPALGEVYAAVEPTRRYFLDLAFAPEAVPPPPDAADEIDRELFRSDSHLRPPLKGSGLQVVGGPRGEGQALLIAHRVHAALEAGNNPDDVLILVPSEDDDVATIRATLSSWGIPVEPGPTRRLATTPAVAALRLAIRLPVEGWEVTTLARLLRNGAVGWDKLDLGDPFRRFEAAAAASATRVFRNRGKLRKALDRQVDEAKKPQQARTQQVAIEALDHLAGAIDAAARPGPWRAHMARLFKLAGDLGLDLAELAPLRDALEAHAWVLDQVGPAIAAQAIRWGDFVEQVERIVADAEPLPTAAADATGRVRVAVVGTVDAARAAVVIVANLAEKSFPAPGTVPLDPIRAAEPAPDPQLPFGDDPTPAPIDADLLADRPTDLTYAREMLRFLRATASADEVLILAYPTTDVTGEGLLPAGFLDEVLRRLDPAAGVVETHTRFDPLLRGHEALAIARGDARVLAVARACEGDLDPVRRLAAHPDHAEALRGVAEAFRVGHARRERFDFNAHDGWLLDGDAVAHVAREFGPDHPFSPSQLESYATCPFQFFQRYVLGLKVVDGVEELAEDYAGRGRDVHEVLEEVHKVMVAEGTTDLAAHLPILIQTNMAARLDGIDRDAPPGEADVAEVLREIDARRSGKALDRYLAQFRAYAAKVGAGAVPHQFEVKFGQPDKPGSLDYLILGAAEREIRLQGVIDRIDLVSVDGATRFRVIDYKTGAAPSPGDVKSGLASQLPLYAMAVEQLVMPAGDAAFLDAGYWSLPKDGFKGVKLEAWEDFRARVVDFVLALVGELRHGVYPVFSQDPKCEQRCDFARSCRVREVRAARKAWNDRPSLETLRP